MGLKQELDAFKAQFVQTAPAGRFALYTAKIEELRQSFARDNAITEGDIAPDFSLPDAKGGSVTLSALLAQGPTVITFYRGGWCPYCNIQLRAYQAILPQIAAAGASLVAMSPQAPDRTLSTAETNALTFHVLSDLENRVARSFGLVYSLPEEIRAALRSVNKALPEINGYDIWELPVPSTYVVTGNGRVTLAHIDVDYTQRLEPEEILAALRSRKAA
jgi:peroxiredoxin